MEIELLTILFWLLRIIGNKLLKHWPARDSSLVPLYTRLNSGTKVRKSHYRVGDWVMVKFRLEEQEKMSKLSHPWHRPYRVVKRSDPDLSVSKVYYLWEGTIQVHQDRICVCPPELRLNYFWNGTCIHSVGRLPRWVQNVVQKGAAESLVEPSLLIHKMSQTLQVELLNHAKW